MSSLLSATRVAKDPKLINARHMHKERWHAPEVLKSLRGENGLSQAYFAERINGYMEEHMADIYHPSIALTQSMVSDLELGRTTPSLPILYAIAGCFHVEMNELLAPVLRNYMKGNVFVGYDGDGDKTEAVEKLAILTSFPSPLFMGQQSSDLLGVKRNIRQTYTEIYALPSFITFLFSPVKPYSRKERIQTLHEIIDFFSSSIYRSIYFTRSSDFSSWQSSSLSIFKNGDRILYPLPDMMNADDQEQKKLISVESDSLLHELEEKYLNSGSLINESMIFLQIALQVLEAGSPNQPMKEIENFYQECKKRTFAADALKAVFSPEFQNHLASLDNVQ